MSMITIQGLGQENVRAIPIQDIPDQAYAGLQTYWNRIREECEQVFTPSQCQALLGVRPTILDPGTDGIAWYWLVLAGVVVGKVVL